MNWNFAFNWINGILKARWIMQFFSFFIFFQFWFCFVLSLLFFVFVSYYRLWYELQQWIYTRKKNIQNEVAWYDYEITNKIHEKLSDYSKNTCFALLLFVKHPANANSNLKFQLNFVKNFQLKFVYWLHKIFCLFQCDFHSEYFCYVFGNFSVRIITFSSYFNRKFNLFHQFLGQFCQFCNRSS